MKSFVLTILVFIICLILTACPNKKGQDVIYIKNASEKKIAFQIRVNKQDATFYCSDVGRMILFEVESNSTFILDDADDYSSWDDYLKSLTVFILDGEQYDKYWQEPCDTIRKYVPILHRYQLKLEDLQRMNWTVVYPPEE
jgi:hypothetical protein